MNAAPRVVVTGLGAVGAAGVGRAALEALLERGEPRLTEVDRSAGLHGTRAAQLAALAGPVEIGRYMPLLDARRMSVPSRFAVVAAREALADAGLEQSAEPDPSIAVATATAFGPAAFTQRLLDQILDEGPAAASPALFTECVTNAPAAHIALACRARGPNYTLVQGEAGPLAAVRRGAAEVATGRARMALVGAVEEITPLVHAILDRFRALARAGADGSERARPFDRRRDGYIAADGATLIVLETAEAARERGARVLAQVRAAWSACDPSAAPSGWGEGSAVLAQAVRRRLDRCGVAIECIDRIVSGASGSRNGDRLEARVLRRVWGDRPLPPVLAPKGATGEYGGAFLGAAVLAAAGASFGPTAGFEETDPEIELRPHDGAPLAPARCVLVTSLAAGGPASWLVLERP